MSEPGSTTATGVSMRDLLASCAAAKAVSRPPRAPERPEGAKGARGTARPATVDPQPHDGTTRHLPRSA